MTGKQPGQRDGLYDLITFLLLIASVVVLGGSLLIVANPEVPFNPLPLPTLPERLVIPTWTPSFTPTDTPTPSDTPSITPTPTATHTFTPSHTPTVTNTPTDTPTPTFTVTPSLTNTPVLPGLPTNTPDPATPVTNEGTPAQPGIVIPTPGSGNPASPFAFSAGEATYQRNTNESGCDWLSIAGTVTGLFGEPVPNIAVEVAGEQFLEVRFSGTQPDFGASGFEFNLGNRPRRATYSIRLLGATGEALSDYVFVTTGDTCDRNITIVQFVQNREY